MVIGVQPNFQSVIILKKNSVLNVVLPIETELYVVLYDRKKKKTGRPRKDYTDKLLKKKQYVKFTKNQRKYMKEVFLVNIYPDNYNYLFNIIKSIGYIGQYINIKNIKSWFSNERFRNNVTDQSVKKNTYSKKFI